MRESGSVEASPDGLSQQKRCQEIEEASGQERDEERRRRSEKVEKILQARVFRQSSFRLNRVASFVVVRRDHRGQVDQIRLDEVVHRPKMGVHLEPNQSVY